MIRTAALTRASLAILAGAFALSACGNSPAATTVATPTSAVTLAPTPTTAPTPTAQPSPTQAAAVDPAADLKIAAPFTFKALDENLARVFITAMEDSLGSMASVFHVGVRSAVKDGDTVAWVIVMSFPDLPMDDLALLDGAANGAANGAKVEKQTIAGKPVRVIVSGNQAVVLTLVGDKLVMAIGDAKARGISVITAVLQAN